MLTESSDTPSLDAELLVCHVLNKDRTYLYTYGDRLLNENELKHLDSFLSDRKTGKPMAYILGYKSFWSLKLKVNESTLIPRPETELLVEQALQFLKQHERPVVLDLGTGTGAIALAIAKERPDALVFAIDISKNALSIAKENAKTHDLSNVTFIQSNWFDSLPTIKPILIVSNPPYIEENSPILEQYVKDHEPYQALISQQQGLADIRVLIQDSPSWLSSNGMLLMEFGLGQAQAIRALLDNKGYQSIHFYTDLQGITRAVSAINRTQDIS